MVISVSWVQSIFLGLREIEEGSWRGAPGVLQELNSLVRLDRFGMRGSGSGLQNAPKFPGWSKIAWSIDLGPTDEFLLDEKRLGRPLMITPSVFKTRSNSA